MATEDYPCGLPGPLRASYAYSEVRHTRANDVQSGPPRYELLNESAPAFFDVAWSFSQGQLQVFEGWFKSRLSYGAVAFNMDLPIGEGLVAHECNLLDYTRTLNGKRWRVSGRLVAVELEYQADDCLIDDIIRLTNTFTPLPCASLCGALAQVNDIVEVQLPSTWGVLKYGTDYS